MRVSVRLGEPIWRQVQTKKISLELREAATVGDMLQALKDGYPALNTYLCADEVPLTIIVADDLVSPDSLLADGAEVMIFLAIAGG